MTQHEDVALKVMSDFFRDEILPALQIEGKVVGSITTESIHPELKKGLKHFRMYEAHMSYQHNKEVTTYVMFSGHIKNPMTEFTEGINTYRV